MSEGKYGCWNTPRKDGYCTKIRAFFDDGSFEYVDHWIENRNSKECRYDMRAGDPRCVGCLK